MSPAGPDRAILTADTSRKTERVQVDVWRAMSSVEKMNAVDAASRSVRELAVAGIRLRHPRASDREVFLRYALLTLGRDLAVRAYPEIAGLPGVGD